MKENIKESLQFILQHNAIGSPLVQHAQNLARHITSQYYEAMTANEEYPSGSDNGLQWFRDLEASPQVTDEQIEDIVADYLWTTGFGGPVIVERDALKFARAILALSAPPVADVMPTFADDDAGRKAFALGYNARVSEEAKPVAADAFEAADRAIATAYPGVKGYWGEMKVPNHGILRGAIAKEIFEAAAPQEQAPADKDALLALTDDQIDQYLAQQAHSRRVTAIVTSQQPHQKVSHE